MDYHHRSTVKANKGHKRGQHASKRAVNKKFHGRVEGSGGRRASRASIKSLASMRSDGKKKRQNSAKQIRQSKKLELLKRRRQYGGQGPPKTVGIVPLSATANPAQVRDTICRLAQDVAVAPSAGAIGNPMTLSLGTYKQRVTLLTASSNELLECLDIARVSDVVIFVASFAAGTDDCVDETGDTLMCAIRAQGLPSPVGVYQGLSAHPAKKQAEFRKYASRLFLTEFGSSVKVADVTNNVQLVRAIATAKPKALSWRSARPYLLALGARTLAPAADGTATLQVCGFLRGSAFNVKRLVHIADVGTFQVEKVTAARDVMPLVKGNKCATATRSVALDFDGSMGVKGAAAAADREDMTCMAEFDAMAAEQTWPTDDEMREASVRQAKLLAASDKMITRVPKGINPYHAAWLEEGDDYDFVGGSDGSGDEDGDAGMGGGAAAGGAGGAGAGAGAGAGGGGGVDMEDSDEDAVVANADLSDDDDDDGSDISGEEDMEDPVERRKRLAEENLEFPNEIDTPRDIPAHERFARYRGLKSFRATPWNPKWNLPRSYARAYQFKDFNRTQRRVLGMEKKVKRALDQAAIATLLAEKSGKRKAKRAAAAAATAGAGAGAGMSLDDDGDVMTGGAEAGDSRMDGAETTGVALAAAGYLAPGDMVVLNILKVPVAALARRSKTSPLVVGGLLKHENRMSVVHFNVSRTDNYVDPIKSKDVFEFHVGWRRYDGGAIYSQNNLNCDKHKFERFFNLGCHNVASLFAPVTFGPMTVLMFKCTPGEPRTLVATGTLLGVDPDRVILKEVMLTGYPIKVKRKFAVVKYMFFNADDVRYFKPIELHTKYGMHGHIKEPLGTHGLMKCVFSKAIRNNDTVCMSLYKRVYPKLMDVEATDRDFMCYSTTGVVTAVQPGPKGDAPASSGDLLKELALAQAAAAGTAVGVTDVDIDLE